MVRADFAASSINRDLALRQTATKKSSETMRGDFRRWLFVSSALVIGEEFVFFRGKGVRLETDFKFVGWLKRLLSFGIYGTFNVRVLGLVGSRACIECGVAPPLLPAIV
jgi:hypothetical protein